MMKVAASFLALLGAGAAQQQICSQYGTATSGDLTINNNLWGSQGDGITGSQCTSVTGGQGAFTTTWTWNGAPSNVKSYANAGLTISNKQHVSDITSIPTSVKWTYDNTNIKADVAYDLFTAADANHATSSGDYELMIWLASYGGQMPIGSKKATVQVGGASWDLYYGTGSGTTMQTYSFVAPAPINNWSGDIKQFFQYLATSENYPAASQFLLTSEFGTEPITGTQATLTVSDLTMSVS